MTDDIQISAAPGAGVRLDDIFCINVRRHPDAIALIDPPDRASFTDGEARALTYAEADRAVTAMARLLRSLRLPAGAPVAVQLPNTVEGVIALLGVIRANLVPAPVPLLWRRTEISRALGEISAQTLITCARVAQTNHASLALQVAADTFCIRFVCAFGADLPDGIVPLDDVFAGRAAEPEAAEDRFGKAPDIAMVTFDVGAEGPIAAFRTHAQVLAGGLAVTMEAELPRQAVLLSAMLPSSFAVIAASLAPWLLTGGTLALHQPFDPAVFAKQTSQTMCHAVVLPGPVAPRLAEAGVIGETGAQVLAVWRAPERFSAVPPWSGAVPLLDLLAFGEIGVIPLRREAGRPGRMRAGPLNAPSDAADGTLVATIARSPTGTLALSGPMIPAQIRVAGSHAMQKFFPGDEVDTGYPCRIDANTGTLTLGGTPAGIVGVGGYRFAMTELQDLVGRAQPDSLLAALPDLLAGDKLAGVAPDPSAVREALAAIGVSPLIVDAFRDRPYGEENSAA